MYPDRKEAEEALEAASRSNPGRWIGHSQHAAEAAAAIARFCAGMDEQKAFVLGLLHDIGRYSGVVGERHSYDGYVYCMERGWDEVARVCMTHSFVIKDQGSVLGRWDTTSQETAFMMKYLAGVDYDDYDRLIQLCDNLALPERLCLIEERMVDVTRRYGVNEFTVERFNRICELRDYFSQLAGRSIYECFPK